MKFPVVIRFSLSARAFIYFQRWKCQAGLFHLSSLSRDRERKTRAEDRKYPVKNSFRQCARQMLDQTEGEREAEEVCAADYPPSQPTSQEGLSEGFSQLESEQAAKQKERGDERAGEKQKVTECESKKQTNKKKGGWGSKK